MLSTYSITDIGRKRQLNEDCVFALEHPVGSLPNLFVVADGMGGHKAGEYASHEAVEIMRDSIGRSRENTPERIFKEAVYAANREIFQDSEVSPEHEGMGTTVVACSVVGKRLCTVNVGDSRLYVVNEREIRQITMDHSLVEQMIREGILDRDRARTHPQKNIITRAVGVSSSVQADFFEVELQEGDRILMCSDGLSNMLEDGEMMMIINSLGSLEEKARMLIDAANGNGGRDNISVILIDPFS